MNAGLRRRNRPAARGQRGVMLVEALVGLLIFSIGILALIALQAVGIRENNEAAYRSAASFVVDRIIGDLWAANTANLTTFAGTYSATSKATEPWSKSVTAALPAGSAEVVVTGGSVTVTVTWQAPGAPAHSFKQRAVIVDG